MTFWCITKASRLIMASVHPWSCCSKGPRWQMKRTPHPLWNVDRIIFQSSRITQLGTAKKYRLTVAPVHPGNTVLDTRLSKGSIQHTKKPHLLPFLTYEILPKISFKRMSGIWKCEHLVKYLVNWSNVFDRNFVWKICVLPYAAVWITDENYCHHVETF